MSSTIDHRHERSMRGRNAARCSSIKQIGFMLTLSVLLFGSVLNIFFSMWNASENHIGVTCQDCAFAAKKDTHDSDISLQRAAQQCVALSPEQKKELSAEINDYEASERFTFKIDEVKGEASPLHRGVEKYLRENVLEPNWSVLDLGCAAGMMLRLVKEAYEGGIGDHSHLVGVELVTGWVKFAREYLKPQGIDVFEGDITEFSLPPPYENTTFDLVMLNDVAEHVQKDRYGCLFSQLQKVTHKGSIVFMHTPNPQGQLSEKMQYYENVLPHHFVIWGMALAGFELVQLEQDLHFECREKASLSPSLLRNVPCSRNQWPLFYNVLFRRVDEAKYNVFDLQ